MLKLIYGRAGARPSNELYSHIKSAIAAGAEERSIIIIVPRHYSHESERRLCSVCGDGASLYCEVLTWERLAVRVFGETGGLADILSSRADSMRRLLSMRVAAEKTAPALSAISRYISRPDYLASLVSLREEFQTHRIDITRISEQPGGMPDELSEKLSDIALLFAAYDRELEGLTDSASLPDRLEAALCESGYMSGKRVYIHGFTEFTAQEYGLLRRIMQSALSLEVSLDCGTPQQGGGEEYDDLFLGQRRTAENLKRLCADMGLQYSEQLIERPSEKHPDIAFLERNLFCSSPERCTGREKRAVSLRMEASVWTECEQAAYEIISAQRSHGYKYRDFAVALSDYDSYYPVLRAVFSRAGIPVFTDRMDDISEKPIVGALRSVLALISGGFKARDMLAFLKTGLAGIDFTDACALENYIQMWNISGRFWTDNRDWTLSPHGFSAGGGSPAANTELERLNSMRRRLFAPFADFLETVPLSKKHPAAVLVEAFYSLLLGIGLDRTIHSRMKALSEAGDMRKSGEYAQLWQLICDILDSIHSTLGALELEFDEFSGFLSLILENSTVGTIPVVLDGVSVAEPGRLRHKDISVLLLLGAESGAFPPRQRPDSILSDENRSELIARGIDVEPPAKSLIYRETDLSYSVLTLPRDRLYISWHRAADGSARPPAYIVRRAAELLGLEILSPSDDTRRLCAVPSALELALADMAGGRSPQVEAAFDYFRDRADFQSIHSKAHSLSGTDRHILSPAAIDGLYGKTFRMTASRADKLGSCRFAYFMQYGLRARAPRKATLDSLESGNLIHFVLEGYVKEIMALGGAKAVSPESSRSIALDLLDRYAADVLGGLADKSGRIRYLFSRIRRSVLHITDNLLEEMQSSEFIPLEFELKFGEDGELDPIRLEADGRDCELEGVVDRLDGWVSGDKLYIRVVDYKSGYKKFELSDIWHGLGMQMLIYMFALEQLGAGRYGRETVGAGVLYAPVREAVFSGRRGLNDDAVKKETSDMLRRNGILLADPDIAKAMDQSPESRFIPVGFKADGSFKAASSVATLAQFGSLKRHVDDMLREMVRQLNSGDIARSPYFKGGGFSACDICDFKGYCGFDETAGRDKKRYLYRVKPDRFWAELDRKE